MENHLQDAISSYTAFFAYTLISCAPVEPSSLVPEPEYSLTIESTMCWRSGESWIEAEALGS